MRKIPDDEKEEPHRLQFTGSTGHRQAGRTALH